MTGLKQRFFEAIQDKARREESPWFDETDGLDELCRKIHPTEAVLGLVKAMDKRKSTGEEMLFNIRRSDGQWKATLSDGGCFQLDVVGDTPQRAVLRLALALITRPSEMPHLQRLFGIDDPASRKAICDAETALRKIDSQISGGISSVEQCQ